MIESSIASIAIVHGMSMLAIPEHGAASDCHGGSSARDARLVSPIDIRIRKIVGDLHRRREQKTLVRRQYRGRLYLICRWLLMKCSNNNVSIDDTYLVLLDRFAFWSSLFFFVFVF